MVVSVFAFTGCGKTDKAATDDTNTTATDTSLTDVQKAGVIILGCDDTFTPMGFRDKDGKIVGFDIDLAQAVADKLGVKLETKAINWDTNVMELNSKNIDVIWNGFSITADRNKEVEYTKPYLNNQIMLVVRADSPIKTKADLAGKLVGYQVQSSADDAIKADDTFFKSLKEAREYDNYQDALLDLTTSSRIDAVAIDKIMIQYVAAQDPGKYKILDEGLGKEYMGIGCRKGSVALREAIDTALDELDKDGTINTISTKWFGSNIVIRDIPKLTQEQLDAK